MASSPLLPPLFPEGQGPSVAGLSPEELAQMKQMTQFNKYLGYATESCVFKTVLAGGAGFVTFPFAFLSPSSLA